jgi:TPR repeat protein
VLGAVAYTGVTARASEDERSVVKDRLGLVLNTFACRGGDGAACNYVARATDEGWGGVTKDPARAARFYELACAARHPLGCSNLGVSYQAGDGVPADIRHAVDLYAEACTNGAKPGCTNLGNLMVAGVGVPRNLDRALSLVRIACEGGHSGACASLVALTNQSP